MHVRELFDLTGKVALVTGGSRGLGLEIAQGLGEAGARVVISARRQQFLDEALAELQAGGIDARSVVADVSQPADAEAALQACLDAFGRIDILVNNAGASWGAPVLEMPLDRWRMVWEANATGTFLMSQTVGRRMIEQGEGGRIVNVTSVVGVVSAHYRSLDAIGYTASKGAIVAMTRDLAVRWAQYNILVNAVAPSFFETRLSKNVIGQNEQQIIDETPLGRIGRPGELKGVVVFLAAPASSYVTGQILPVDGGTTAC
jgi:gluconate 5-dehydrogenase